uniref:Hepatocyte growth factor-regulated tyrosine kinase substrate n=1 Tax=Panagrellus redivivus TaxID=6233 RepID=A0A7E4V318_PANRE
MSKQFERTLEATTDQTVVEADWGGIMECIDMIRGKEVSARDAVGAISRRLKITNPHVIHHTLVLLEACMKNCGTQFHAEVISTKFLDQLKELVINSPPGKVQEKLLELIQTWHGAFFKKPEYAAISDVHRILTHLNFKFPAAKESDFMFSAQCAPDWADGDQCYRCRTEFKVFTRKHHCRACGQIFCNKCSNHQAFLPQFGIEKKVRVCVTCFENDASKATTKQTDAQKEEQERLLRELEQKEEEELQLALALSQSEAEAKKNPRWTSYTNQDHDIVAVAPTASVIDTSVSGDSIYRGAASVVDDRAPPSDNLSVDSNLARYLDRVYWEKKVNDTPSVVDYGVSQANAPPPSDTASNRNFGGLDSGRASVMPVQSSDPLASRFAALKMDNEDAEVDQTKRFCDMVKERVDTMDNRMKSNLMRGRSIVNDSSIHSLFVQLTEMHGEVMERLNSLEGQREFFERLQDHLAHIQESRQAVNALREEHERQRQERLLAEQRERQSQMQQKLMVMRAKKHEMLLFQRHMALQRFQEQEQSLQQRRQVMSQMPAGYPGVYAGVSHMDPNIPTSAPQYIPAMQAQQQQQQPQIYYQQNYPGPTSQPQQQQQQQIPQGYHQFYPQQQPAAHVVYQNPQMMPSQTPQMMPQQNPHMLPQQQQNPQMQQYYQQAFQPQQQQPFDYAAQQSAVPYGYQQDPNAFAIPPNHPGQ